jgi:hypothetical protein
MIDEVALSVCGKNKIRWNGSSIGSTKDQDV